MQEQEFEQLKQSVKVYKAKYLFSEASKNIQQILNGNSVPKDKDNNQYEWLIQQLAQCIYKDPERQPGKRLDDALETLDKLGLIDTINPETLGITGAIYKRKFQHGRQQRFLDLALDFYLRGHKASIASKQTDSKDYDGYNPTNAAFLLDQKAHLLTQNQIPQSQVNPDIQILKDEASQLRNFIKDELSKRALSNWWQKITLAETYFGLGELDKAEEAFKDVTEETRKDSWQEEISIRQLAQLYSNQYQNTPEEDKARELLIQLIKKTNKNCKLSDHAAEDVLNSLIIGKIGLALSGGGFRASFYHLGVLAQLADMDLLRKVEVLSCVSGGSIIGAMYYLAVRDALQSKKLDSLDRKDYVEIVDKLTDRFTKAVQSNIRTQIFSNPIDLAKMIISDYSRTDKLAELYEKKLYDGLEDNQTPFKDLKISPQGFTEFHPRRDNWKIPNKVPALVINAATLNTGNSWQFTANGMGEAAWSLETEINSNDHLVWKPYDQLNNTKYKNFSLAKAVAASSTVPGIFHPVPLPDLYPEHTVQLVDGGVYDNQGLSALIDQSCDIVLVSDGSGQMDTDKSPKTNPVSVLYRSNDMLQARLRTAQYRELEVKKESGLIKDAMFIHLRLEFEPNEIMPNGITSAPLTKKDLSYSMPKEYQIALSKIRTDLDSFSDIEIQALMYSGYMMTETYLPDLLKMHAISQKKDKGNWSFLNFLNNTENSTPTTQKHLDTGKYKFLKYFHLTDLFRDLKKFYLYGKKTLLQFWNKSASHKAAIIVSILYVVVFLTILLPDWTPMVKTVGTLLTAIASIVLLVAAPSSIHIYWVDKLFLALGKIPGDKKDKEK